MKHKTTYTAVFLIMLATLSLLPKRGGYIWQPEFINPATALLIRF